MANQKALRFIEDQLLDDRSRSIDFPELIDLLTFANNGEKQKIISAIRSRNPNLIGRFVFAIINDSFKEQARNEARGILNDDTLSSDEIDKIFK